MKTFIIDDRNAELYRGGFAKDSEISPNTPDSVFYIRPMPLRAGQKHKGHSHYIDHVGNLVSGHAIVRWRREDGSDEGVIDMRVPAKILVRADTWHEIEAVTDCEWECWFAAAEADRLDVETGNWIFEKVGYG